MFDATRPTVLFSSVSFPPSFVFCCAFFTPKERPFEKLRSIEKYFIEESFAEKKTFSVLSMLGWSAKTPEETQSFATRRPFWWQNVVEIDFLFVGRNVKWQRFLERISDFLSRTEVERSRLNLFRRCQALNGFLEASDLRVELFYLDSRLDLSVFQLDDFTLEKGATLRETIDRRVFGRRNSHRFVSTLTTLKVRWIDDAQTGNIAAFGVRDRKSTFREFLRGKFVLFVHCFVEKSVSSDFVEG